MKDVQYRDLERIFSALRVSFIYQATPPSNTRLRGWPVCKVRPTCTANPIKENVSKYNQLVSYLAPCGVAKLWFAKP